MKKPIGVYIIAILLLISTLFTFLLMSLFFYAFIRSSTEMPVHLVLMMILTWLLSIFGFIVSIGLLKFKRWAHHFILVFALIGIFLAPINLILQSLQELVDIPQVFSLGLSMIFNIFILLYFPKKKIKIHFK